MASNDQHRATRLVPQWGPGHTHEPWCEDCYAQWPVRDPSSNDPADRLGYSDLTECASTSCQSEHHRAHTSASAFTCLCAECEDTRAEVADVVAKQKAARGFTVQPARGARS